MLHQVLIRFFGSGLFSVLSENRRTDKYHKHGHYFLRGVIMKTILNENKQGALACSKR